MHSTIIYQEASKLTTWMGLQSPMVHLEAEITSTPMPLVFRKRMVVPAQGVWHHLRLWVLITIASQATQDQTGSEHSCTPQTFYGTDSSVEESRSRAAIHQTYRGSVRRSQLPYLRTWRFGSAQIRASTMRMWRLNHLNCTYKVRLHGSTNYKHNCTYNFNHQC